MQDLPKSGKIAILYTHHLQNDLSDFCTMVVIQLNAVSAYGDSL